MQSFYPSHKYWPGGQFISVSLPVSDNRGFIDNAIMGEKRGFTIIKKRSLAS